MTYLHKIIIFVTFLTLDIAAVCQPTFSFLGVEHGLSNNSVRNIYKDHKGFMWFGMYDGLNRYDGYDVKVYRNNFEDTSSLIDNFISTIGEDKDDYLWLGTKKGVCVYNRVNNHFDKTYFSSKKDGLTKKLEDVIKDLKVDKFNNVLVASELSGLLFFKNASRYAVQIPLLQTNGIKSDQYGVQAITVDAKQNVWVFVQGKGLCRLDYKRLALVQINGTIDNVNCVYANGDSIWLGSKKGLFNFNIQKNTIENIGSNIVDSSISGNFIASLIMDREKKLWIGTSADGLKIWDTKSKTIDHVIPESRNGALASKAVFALYEDESSRMWIGTLRGGINIFDPQKRMFKSIARDASITSGLSGNYISALYQSSDNTLWVGTDGNGINASKDSNFNSFVQYQHHPAVSNSLSNNNVMTIQEDFEHTLWVATFLGGINKFNSKSGTFERYHLINDKTGIENNVIFMVYEDLYHNLWVTALRQGNMLGALYRFNRKLNKFEVFDSSLSDLFVLKEDNAGNLWGGTINQLVKIDRLNKKHQFYNIGQTVRAIQPEKNGKLWIGCEGGGLVNFDCKLKKITERFTTSQGMCSNSVISLLEDGDGNLWMGTNNGLSRFDIKKRTFKNYYQNDGLQSNQYYYNAAVKLKSGAMAFGGIKGFDIFFPNEAFKKNLPPPLILTDVTISGSPIEKDVSYIKKVEGTEIKEIKVPYEKAVFSFNFTALEFSSPANISYTYFMEGWDKGWSYGKNNRSATYTHLPEGSYTFRVKCSDSEGNWTLKELAIRIIVLPPWYRSWWTYTIYILIIGSLVYFYLTYRAKQTRLKYEVKIARLNADKEKVEREKENVEHAKEKIQHEAEKMVNEKEKEMGERRAAFFTNISHEFRTPLTLIINPLKDFLKKDAVKNVAGHAEETAELNTVYRNARRMLSLVDQLLLFRKADSGNDVTRPSKLNFYNLCNEVFLCFTQLAKSKNVVYSFHADNETLEMYADREKMEIILFNLISNAIKYTPIGGTVSLSVIETGATIDVEVADSGIGISKNNQVRLFEKFFQSNPGSGKQKPGFGIGLYLVKQFTENHKGLLSFESEEGKGTTFKLVFLKGKAHFENTQIVEYKSDEPVFLNELSEADLIEENNIVVPKIESSTSLEMLVTDKQTVLVVDDDDQLRQYVVGMFKNTFNIFEAVNGKIGMQLAKENTIDIIISDIKMEGGDGIDFCKAIKGDSSLSHIPVILLTGTSSQELKIEGIEGGADDYITKPFEKELLIARVSNLLKSRKNLQQFFFNEITLNNDKLKVSADDKKFLENCVAIIEQNLIDDSFNIELLSKKLGMSRSTAYNKVKAITGQSLNGFIRFIRLRKAAELFINTNDNIGQVRTQVGMLDKTHFNDQFGKLYGMTPAEYIKKFRKPFNNQYTLDKNVLEK